MAASCTAQPPQGDKKLDRIRRESIKIYTDIFRNSPVELLHYKAYDPTLELRRNELGLRFLYRLRSTTTYTDSLNILDVREDRNY